MQHSVNNSTDSSLDPNDRKVAIMAESLYVANLLILPGIAFIFLALLFTKNHGSALPLARSHMEQTMSASIWIAVLLFTVSITVLMLNLAGVEDVTIWMIVVILFTIIHATMVLLGVVGLAKALSGKCWRYPVVGKALPHNCLNQAGQCNE